MCLCMHVCVRGCVRMCVCVPMFVSVCIRAHSTCVNIYV